MYFHYNWYWCFLFVFLQFRILIWFDCWNCGNTQFEVKVCFFFAYTSQKSLVNQTLQPVSWHLSFWIFSRQSVSFRRCAALSFISLAVVAITADANYPVLLLLFMSNKQIKPITSCVPEDFAQESPTRHQVFRLANAKIHKLGISWFILFANKHLFIRNVADISSPPFICSLVCVISS